LYEEETEILEKITLEKKLVELNFQETLARIEVSAIDAKFE
jgi:hypothetical protein